MPENTSTLNLGIDLGTTNSVAAVASVRDNKLSATVRKIERFTDLGPTGGRRPERLELLPSCVTYIRDQAGWKPLVGDAAKKLSYTTPYKVAVSVKSQMGNPVVSYPDWEFSDKKPEEISARIIRHILNAINNHEGIEVSKAVITVPASFGVAQKRATLLAAELAGLNVRKENGEYNDAMLFPEPEAVIYAVLTQYANRELDLPCDFSTPKRVMVYDIGGGTLDITLHEVETDKDKQNFFNIKTLATNHFCNLAGNTFDRYLAENMWEKWIAELRETSPAIAQNITTQKQNAMYKLLRYAEETKEKISDMHKDRRECGRILGPNDYAEYGGEMVGGYDLFSSMTRQQFEDCLRPLMGEELSFNDFRRFDTLPLSAQKTILYPVLDVLAKGAKKLNTQDLKIDMVILNGGMSRLYLIQERLEKFFGFPMTTVSDPDKTVAQGAAIYRYYLNVEEEKVPEQAAQQQASAARFGFHNATQRTLNQNIRSLGNVLNDDVYLGVGGGAQPILLAAAGSDLPFSSAIIDGFGLLPGANRIDIPIKEKRGNTYITVARGCINFDKGTYDASVYSGKTISIQSNISRNGILSFSAWFTEDKRPLGAIDIFLGAGEETLKKNRMAAMNAPQGTALVPANAVSNLCDLIKHKKQNWNNPKLQEKIRQSKFRISKCGNPEAFGDVMLHRLEQYESNITFHLLPLARKLARFWTPQQQQQLAVICREWVTRANQAEESPYASPGLRKMRNTYIEAIRTLGVYGSAQQRDALADFQTREVYEQALLYAFGSSGTQIPWIVEKLFIRWNTYASAQDPLQSLGLALYHTKNPPVSNLPKVAERLLERISSGRLESNELNIAVLTLGFLCEQGSPMSAQICVQAKELLKSLPYTEDIRIKATKAVQAASKLLNGGRVSLAEEEDRYLLVVLDKEHCAN